MHAWIRNLTVFSVVAAVGAGTGALAERSIWKTEADARQIRLAEAMRQEGVFQTQLQLADFDKERLQQQLQARSIRRIGPPAPGWKPPVGELRPLYPSPEAPWKVVKRPPICPVSPADLVSVLNELTQTQDELRAVMFDKQLAESEREADLDRLRLELEGFRNDMWDRWLLR